MNGPSRCLPHAVYRREDCPLPPIARRLTIPSMPMIRCDESIAVAESGPLCVVIWRGPVTRRPFEWQRAGLAEVVQRYPDSAASLCTAETTATPPEGELRRAAAQMITSHGDRL